MTWHRVVRADDLPPGAVAPFDDLRDAGVEAVVWRTHDGVVAACDARCPHQWSHLAAEGQVDGAELVCTAHFWRFDVDGTGTKLNVKGRRDVKGPVATHPVREHDGWIEIDLDPPDPTDGGA